MKKRRTQIQPKGKLKTLLGNEHKKKKKVWKKIFLLPFWDRHFIAYH